MPESVGSVSHRDIAWSTPAYEGELHDRLPKPLDEQSYGACRDPQGLLASVACGSDVGISNACRRSRPGTVDDYLCDDGNLQQAQHQVLQSTWDILKSMMAAALFGRVK